MALVLLAVLVGDAPRRSARVTLNELPTPDVARDVVSLVEEGRLGEAIVLADAVLQDQGLDSAQRERLAAARQEAANAQASVVRRVVDFGTGAFTGGVGFGESSERASVEMLLGSVAADMFVVGDVRDLIIQGYRFAVGEPTDPVIIALSAVGLATTLAPEIDWAPSLFKLARRAGRLSGELASVITKAAKGGELAVLRGLMRDGAAVARASSPAHAVRVLQRARWVEDVAAVARGLERSGAQTVRALHYADEAAVDALVRAERLRSAGRVEEALALESALRAAGTRGSAGAKWFRSLPARALKPHPLVGLAKAISKGHAAALVSRALDGLLAPLDRIADALTALVAGWVVVEMMLWLRPRESSARAEFSRGGR